MNLINNNVLYGTIIQKVETFVNFTLGLRMLYVTGITPKSFKWLTYNFFLIDSEIMGGGGLKPDSKARLYSETINSQIPKNYL